jgi:hypothetical protein
MDDERLRHSSRRKRQIYSRLAQLENELELAEPNSLDWEFWCRILETVESLPEDEEFEWKARHIAELRRAVKGVAERAYFGEVPLKKPVERVTRGLAL